MKQFISHFILQSRMAVLGFVVIVACAACGESGPVTGPATLTGGVVGEDGPIMEAKLTATDATGAVVATAEIKGKSHYRLELGADTVYPVLITAKSDHEEIKAVVMEGGHLSLDLSPTSTRIVKSALRMGGLTAENLQSAARATFSLGGGGGGGHGGH